MGEDKTMPMTSHARTMISPINGIVISSGDGLLYEV